MTKYTLILSLTLLLFSWENRNFWENVATDYSDNAKNIEKLAKCTKMKL